MKSMFLPAVMISLQYFLAACSSQNKDPDPPDPPSAVSFIEVSNRPVRFYQDYPGNVVALKEVELRGGVAGYITGIFFKEGSQVQKDQVLYEIDRRKYNAAYEQAKNNVQIAQDNLDKHQLDVDRYTTLDRQHAIPRQTLDYAITDLQNAKLQVVSARSELEKAGVDLDFSIIRAPFGGTIGISQVKLGSLITPGQTLLNTLSSDDPVGVDFAINEKDLAEVSNLAGKRLPENDTTFRLVMPDKSIYPFCGRIYLVDRAVDPMTGTIRIRLEFPNPGRMLRPGMNCMAEVRNQDTAPQTIIPFRAVMEQMGEYFVFVNRNGKAGQVKVQLGKRIGTDVIIRNGLSSGLQIVADGIQNIHENSPLQQAGQHSIGMK